jgi:hypothetical protein
MRSMSEMKIKMNEQKRANLLLIEKLCVFERIGVMITVNLNSIIRVQF